jgi:hypothetical protein
MREQVKKKKERKRESVCEEEESRKDNAPRSVALAFIANSLTTGGAVRYDNASQLLRRDQGEGEDLSERRQQLIVVAVLQEVHWGGGGRLRYGRTGDTACDLPLLLLLQPMMVLLTGIDMVVVG